MSNKVCVKESTISNIGKGLFATANIPTGSIIVEYKGRLKQPGNILNDNRSNIHFSDNRILECPKTDLASFANDAVCFDGERRQLLSTLKSTEPFYKKHLRATINANLKINNNLHRAFLIATTNIKSGDEIFCHYGFPYWFKQELGTIGFLQEDEIDQKGFPKNIFTYPAFESYIKEFYPDSIKFEIKPYKDFYDIIIHTKDGQYILIPMEDYTEGMQCVEASSIV